MKGRIWVYCGERRGGERERTGWDKDVDVGKEGDGKERRRGLLLLYLKPLVAGRD